MTLARRVRVCPLQECPLLRKTARSSPDRPRGVGLNSRTPATGRRSFKLCHAHAKLDATHADPHRLLLHHTKRLHFPLLLACPRHRIERIDE